VSEIEHVIVSSGPHTSLARKRPANRGCFRIGLVQERWHSEPAEHEAALSAGIRRAAEQGAELVCLQELTLSRYFAVDPGGPAAAGIEPEDLPGGPTYQFAAKLAAETGVHVHASLYERAEDEHEDGLGYNTAIIVAPGGELVARTRCTSPSPRDTTRTATSAPVPATPIPSR
jgi:N-carbamoylputrescine amidase